MANIRCVRLEPLRHNDWDKFMRNDQNVKNAAGSSASRRRRHDQQGVARAWRKKMKSMKLCFTSEKDRS
ncbi:MAG: hypothetical protein J5846_03570 [Desulfovibrio sp.]|nr:hypothetical protein [Desulfovibrio sp.]